MPAKNSNNTIVTVDPKLASKKNQCSWTGAACHAVSKAAKKTADLAFRGTVNFTSGVGGAMVCIPPASRLSQWLVYYGTDCLYGSAYTLTDLAKRHAAANYAALVGTNVIGGVLGVQLGQYIAWELIGLAYRSGKSLHKKWKNSGAKSAVASQDDDASSDAEEAVLPPAFSASFRGQSVPMYASIWENVPEGMKIESEQYPDQWVRWTEDGEELSEEDLGLESAKGQETGVNAEVETEDRKGSPLICRMFTLHLLAPMREGDAERKHYVGKMLVAKRAELAAAPTAPAAEANDEPTVAKKAPNRRVRFIQ